MGFNIVRGARWKWRVRCCFCDGQSEKVNINILYVETKLSDFTKKNNMVVDRYILERNASEIFCLNDLQKNIKVSNVGGIFATFSLRKKGTGTMSQKYFICYRILVLSPLWQHLLLLVKIKVAIHKFSIVQRDCVKMRMLPWFVFSFCFWPIYENTKSLYFILQVSINYLDNVTQ